MDNKAVLLLGATGGIGSEVARQLRAASWRVRALRRGGGSNKTVWTGWMGTP